MLGVLMWAGAAGVAVFVIALHGFLLRVVCRANKLDRATLKRCMATAVLLGVIWLVVRALAQASRVAEFPMGVQLCAVAGWLAIQVPLLPATLTGTLRRAVPVILLATVPTAFVALCAPLVLRALFAEAFVVPTGAMARAVQGRHASVECPECSQLHVFGMSHRVASYRVPAREQFRCLSCDHQWDRAAERVRDSSGDRILVDKTRLPQRWQMGVFIPPPDDRDLPQPTHRVTPYVMRVVGLPGEEVEISAGDIFINGQLASKPLGKFAEMWIPVSDTLTAPLEPWPWSCETNAWSRTGREMTSKGGSGDSVFTRPIDARLQYNQSGYTQLGDVPLVGDLRVTIQLAEFSGNGTITLRQQFGPREWLSTVGVDGKITTTVTFGDDEPKVADAGMVEPRRLDNATVTFVYRDGQAAVLVGDAIAAQVSIAGQPAELLRLREDNTATQSLTLVQQHARVHISRITVERDVYYYEPDGMSVFDLTANPTSLGDDEYFVLGDNSYHSKDSRFFGPVPSGSMIGTVGMCYWPPARTRTFD